MRVAAGPSSEPTSRRRDAATTRQLLLSAARRRFAASGYAATTVREIADDAGVTAALISRYFDSKEGLFEACLRGVSAELGTSVGPRSTLEEVVGGIAEQLAGPYTAEQPNQLVLLLRTSGDERAEAIRLDTLQSYARRLAEAAGAPLDGPEGEQILVRAQLALCAAFGIAVLRSGTALEPLASADSADLVGPIRALMHALLGPGGHGR
jgi:AcrR family transcriptional regulator